VVQANLLACERDEAIGKVMNIACGTRYTLLDLHAELAGITGTDIRPVFAPPRPGDVKHSLAAIKTARQSLGFEPSVGWSQGLRRTVEWYSCANTL
jgi:nucleoside-diphosphate-sugar epimerase